MVVHEGYSCPLPQWGLKATDSHKVKCGLSVKETGGTTEGFTLGRLLSEKLKEVS